MITEYLLSIKEKNIDIEIFNANSVHMKHFLGESSEGRWAPGIV